MEELSENVLDSTELINNFHKRNIKFIEDCFSEREEIKPMGLILVPNGDMLYAALDFSTLEIKEQSTDQFHSAIIDNNGIAYAIMAEGWSAQVDKKDFEKIKHTIRPSKHPDRIEIITYYFEAKNISKLVMWEIKREKNIKPFLVLILDQDNDNPDVLLSKFSGFIE